MRFLQKPLTILAIAACVGVAYWITGEKAVVYGLCVALWVLYDD